MQQKFLNTGELKHYTVLFFFRGHCRIYLSVKNFSRA
nr:MAG TPA: hypothetical protein [Caudoviricetes sp.]